MELLESKVKAVTCTLLQSSAVMKECLDHDYCEEDDCLLCTLRSICPYDTPYYDVDKMKDVLGCVLRHADEKLEANADIVEAFKAVSSPFQGFNQVLEEKICCSTCGFTMWLEPYILRELEICIADGDIQGSVNNYFHNRPSLNCDACDSVTRRSTKTCQLPDVLAVIPSSNINGSSFNGTPITPVLKFDTDVLYKLTGAVVNVGDTSRSNEFGYVFFNNGHWKLCVLNNSSEVNVKQVCVLLFDRVKNNETTQELPILSLEKLMRTYFFEANEQAEGEEQLHFPDKPSASTNNGQNEGTPILILNKISVLPESSVNNGLDNEKPQPEISRINTKDQRRTPRFKLFERDSFGKFSCPQCNNKFTLRHRFKMHLTKHYKVDYFKILNNIMNKGHRTKRKGPRSQLDVSERVSCPVCEKMFKTNRICQTHLQNQHHVLVEKEINNHESETNMTTVKKRFKCIICPKSFSDKFNLTRHIKNIHSKYYFSQNREFKCSLCKQEFETNCGLNIHMSLKHHAEESDNVKKPFKCNICSRSFSDSSNFKRHIRNLHSEYYLSQSHEFQCSICNKEFETSGGLNMHMSLSLHSEEKVSVKKAFQCKVCSKSFERKYRLTRHIQNVHSEYYLSQIREFKCNMCEKDFETRCGLNIHMSLSHTTKENNNDKKPFKCNLCPFSFERKCHLKRHTQIVHSENNLSKTSEFQCTICNKSYKTDSILKQHLNKRHWTQENNDYNQPFKCKLCTRSFPDIWSLRRHVQTHHSELFLSQTKKFQCSKCNCSFYTSHSLKRHFNTNHQIQKKNVINKSFKCNQCPASFTSKGHLTRHVQNFHYEYYLSQTKEFKCTMCIKSFDTSVKLKGHVYRNHRKQENNSLKKPFKCNLCQKSFLVKGSLIRHVQNIHPEEKNGEFNCSMCNTSFDSSNGLKIHCAKIHHTLKNNVIKQTGEFKCIMCNRSFASNSNLKKHCSMSHRTLNHNVVNKPFKCNLCPSSFAVKGNLTVHVRNVHCDIILSQTMKYQCIICGVEYESSSSLKKHITLNHRTKKNNIDKKKFECNFCPNSFTQKGNLKRHVQTVHPEENTTSIE